MVIMVCGYRRTGKDTLFQWCVSGMGPEWHVYSGGARNPFVSGMYARAAFADALKAEATAVYGVEVDVEDKETKQYRHYVTGEMVSARDIAIEWGAKRRAEDPNYWCKQVLDAMESGVTYVITDWRFQNEGAYVRARHPSAVTCRVYRAAVEEPPMDVQSEHDLDEEVTDLLLVPAGEIEAAVARFPQYRDYALVAILN